MKLTTEILLTDRRAFGIPASPCQRAACRIIDGLPLGTPLATDPDVIDMVGGEEAVASLPTTMPFEVVLLAGIRSGKSLMCLCTAIRASQTVDVSGCTAGEIPRFTIESLRIDNASSSFNMLCGVMQKPALKPLLIGQPLADTLQIRHPSGRPMEICVVAGHRAGGSLVSRWSFGVAFDEAPRMQSSAEGTVVNLDDERAAIQGRLLPGAQILEPGSPWSPSGTIYELCSEHWQHPSEHIVILHGRGPAMNPAWWTPKRCADLQKRNPSAYLTDVEAEFSDLESGWLNPFMVRDVTRDTPFELPPINGRLYGCAVDLGGGSAGGNPNCMVIIEGYGDAYRVACVREWRAVDPEELWRSIAAVCRTYGIRSIKLDQYAASPSIALARQVGLSAESIAWTQSNKLQAFTDAAALVHSRRVQLSPDPQFQRDLLAIKRRVRANGTYEIILPKTADGRHADYGPAFCMALADVNSSSDDEQGFSLQSLERNFYQVYDERQGV